MKTNIIYTCPKCDSDLRHICITTYPSIDRMECPKCGWYYEEGNQEVLRIPFQEKDSYFIIFNNQTPCLYCSQYPVKGGTGDCHCILGMKNVTIS